MNRPTLYTLTGIALLGLIKNRQKKGSPNVKCGKCQSEYDFEDLVNETERVMRHLANFLGIQFDAILLTPTFNKFPIGANTSFATEEAGILNSTLTRYKTLKDEELDTIDKMTKEKYRNVLDYVVSF